MAVFLFSRRAFVKAGMVTQQGLCFHRGDSERCQIWDRLSEPFETSSLGQDPPRQLWGRAAGPISAWSPADTRFTASHPPHDPPLAGLLWVATNPTERWRPLEEQLSTCTEKTGTLQVKDGAKTQMWQNSEPDRGADVQKPPLHRFCSSSALHGRRQDSLAQPNQGSKCPQG